MQWSQALGKMVPAITTAEAAVGWFEQEAAADEPTAVPAPRRANKAAPVAPKNILTLAKSRLREVKQELKKLKSLEKERGELERLIAAAEEKKPRAVVREIKRSAG